MSTGLELKPKDLKKLAKSIRGLNIKSIKRKHNMCNTRNEELAGQKESREVALCDNMFVQVDEIGLSKLIYSFTDSYNRCTNRTILHTIVDTDNYIPDSMTELFMSNLSGVSRGDTRWFVGGNRWGGSVGSHSGATSAVRKHYNDVALAIGKMLEAVEHHRDILEGFVKWDVTARHYASSTGFASSAIISRLNYVSDDATNALVGINGRDGSSDAIVSCVRNVLDALQRNLEIASAKGEELADQAGLLASGVNAADSKVELIIYRPELLASGRGLENAYVEQHEERYRILKNSLTTNVYEVVDFIARPTGSRGRTIATLCAEAINAINEWEKFTAGDVSVEIKEALDPSTPYSFRTWSKKQSQHRRLEDYLPNSLIKDIAAAKKVLREWKTAFEITENYARSLSAAMDNDAHLSGLSYQVEQAIYPLSTFQDLQIFAVEAKQSLERQAAVYNGFADFIKKNVKEGIELVYAGDLQRGADYFLAIAQTIETDFWGVEFLGKADRTNLFEIRTVTGSKLSVKENVKDIKKQKENSID